MNYKEVLTKKADAYTDALNEAKTNSPEMLEKMSPGEIGWGLAGAGGGAAIGYMLSKLLHRKPSTRQKLLYALLGAAAGGGGSQLLLSRMPGSDGFGGSKRDEMRINNAMPTEPARTTEPAPADNSIKPKWLTARNVGLASSLVGAYRGSQLGASKGGLLNPNMYEYIQRLRHMDKDTLESRLNGAIQGRRIPKHTVLTAGRHHGFTVQDAGGNSIRLLDNGTNLTRGLVNGVAGATLHGLAGYGAGKAVEALVDKYSQNIDAGNAAVSKAELLARAGQ